MQAARLVQSWPVSAPEAQAALRPRQGLLRETGADGVFVQETGPFSDYERRVSAQDAVLRQTITYRIDVPWFGWLLRWPVRRALTHPRAASPWWAPPDLWSARQVRVMALLAVASLTSIFANTIFTQTVSFAGDSFGVGGTGQGLGGVVVRIGVVITLPFAMLADRRGRRTVLVWLAWLTPVLCAAGALAPSFPALVASQTIARPLGLAMGVLIAVVATEEVPRNSRAYALSVTTLAGGLGAGVAVGALKLADLGANGWRLAYVMALLWLPVALSLQRHLPETRRFAARHDVTVALPRRRFAVIATVAFVGNVFVAPVSYFQNRYLNHVRGLSGGEIALFTLTTATPASIGLIVGGRAAELVGRRVLILTCLPITAVLLVGTYATSGPAMWATALAGGIVAGIAYPALAVYRTELFPTGNRSRANAWVTVASLAGGSLGLLGVGWALDRGAPYWAAMLVVAVFELAAAAIAYAAYPETAHLSLEEINPGDPALDS
jgi:MFS family permease